MTIAYLSIGSNIGEKKQNLLKAIELLKDEGVKITKISDFYTTAPVGFLEQDEFVNAVLKITTELSAYELLDKCLFIELEMGRKRIIRWGPRNIDIDVLLYDNISLDDEKLTIPHPRMFERGFVLVPLADVYEDGFYDLSKILEDIDTSDIRKI